MDNDPFDQIQIVMLVTQLMAKRQFDELGSLACQDERVLQHLTRKLRDGAGPSCFSAATALSKAGQPAVRPLLTASTDDNYIVRQLAALALGDIGDLRALHALVSRLGDDNEVVRQAAAVSLGKLGSPDAVVPLLHAMDDESELVRRAAVNALGLIGDPRALPQLRRAAAEDVDVVAKRAREVAREMAEHER